MFNRIRQRLSYRLTRDTVLVAMVLGLVLNLIQITLDYFTARESMDREVRALIEISPYKFDSPGGSGAPPHVHKVVMQA